MCQYVVLIIGKTQNRKFITYTLHEGLHLLYRSYVCHFKGFYVDKMQGAMAHGKHADT